MIQRKDVSFLIKLLHFSFGEQANMTEEKKKANGKKEKGETFIATVFFLLREQTVTPIVVGIQRKDLFAEIYSTLLMILLVL